MPQADPLDKIMTTLRDSNSIDPNQASARKARMQTDRGQMGANPGMHPMEGARQTTPKGKEGAPARGTPEEGVDGQVQVADKDMTPIIIDQLNETILSIKVQIHRERDKEKRRGLERQAENIRQQVVDMGGDPIWADESVEEGLAKIQGHGYVGAPQLQNEIDKIMADMQKVEGFRGTEKEAHYTKQWGGIDQYLAGHQARLGTAQTQLAGVDSPQVPAATPTDGLSSTLQTIGEHKAGDVPIRNMVQDGRGTVDFRDGQVFIGGPTGETSIGHTRIEGGQSFAFEDDIRAAMRQVGLTSGVLFPDVGSPIRINGQEFKFPDMGPTGMEGISEFFTAAGMDLASMPTQEDYVQLRAMEVERVAMERRQIVQRELDRFEADFPNEFEKAKGKVRDTAAGLKGEIQEEMAVRGVYYSSVMGNALTNVDDKTMEIIGEIAADAARTVANLRADIRDINEWEILESAIAQKEAAIEFTETRTQLAMALAEVAYRNDMATIEAYRTQVGTYMELYDREIQSAQAQYDRIIQEQGFEATVQLADSSPIVRKMLEQAGLLGAVKSGPASFGAQLVGSIVDIYLPLQIGMEKHQAEMTYTASQIALNNARIGQIGIENAVLQEQNNLKRMIDKFTSAYLTGNLSGLPGFVSEADIAREAELGFTVSSINREQVGKMLDELGIIRLQSASSLIDDPLTMMNIFAVMEETSRNEQFAESEWGQAILTYGADLLNQVNERYPDKFDNMTKATDAQKHVISEISQMIEPDKGLIATYKEYSADLRRNTIGSITINPELSAAAKRRILGSTGYKTTEEEILEILREGFTQIPVRDVYMEEFGTPEW